jgi:catechol 2,3-dioxygenase-like lactoylglutathione lyase family enzyme
MSQPGDDPYPPVVPAPGRDARAPGVTRDIYGMPAFVSFAVRDIEAARDWYTRGLDFIDLFSVPGPTGVPLLVHLRRWRFQDILLRPADGEVVPGTTVTLSIAAVVGELDAWPTAPAATAAVRSRAPPTPPGTPATSAPATPMAMWSSSPPPARPRTPTPPSRPASATSPTISSADPGAAPGTSSR